jgi:outer membrane protein TolC
MLERRIVPSMVAVIITMMMMAGCAMREPALEPGLAAILADHPVISIPDWATTADNSIAQVQYVSEIGTPDPNSIRGAAFGKWKPPQKWELTLEQVIQMALANSTVLRDLGARVVQAPGLTPTIYGPAIQNTDPNLGIEAALSAFDAQVTSDLFFEDNDRVLNNEIVGQGVNFFKQELSRFQSSLSKQAATGTLFTLRHNFDGDLNNSDRNLIDGRAWTWDLEGEVRQPLLQGRGSRFNRIAGPNATPGEYNGVYIARLNADISITQLEIALRDYLSDVENAYWDLAFAYCDLEVKTKARDRSLDTYQDIQARADKNLLGAEEDKVAQAKEQYFRFEQDVQNALGGRLLLGTRVFNGSGGGTFQGIGGVYANERRLRLITGLTINDGRLIYTATLPTTAPVTYDWNSVVSNTLSRRTELRRQQLNVDRRALELTASRNFTKPRLDAVGTYRYRALGDRIYDPHVPFNGSSIETGTYEWRLGLSLSYPVGYRQAHAGVRNAQLRLARERDLLQEIERQVVYGVSNAIAENDRAYEVLRLAKNRSQAARDQYEILVPEERAADIRQIDLNALLDSERRLADAETSENRVRVQYALAIKNLNFEMGTLLEYYNIHLAESNGPRRKPASSRGIHRLWNRATGRFSRPKGSTTRLESLPTEAPPTLSQELSLSQELMPLKDVEQIPVAEESANESVLGSGAIGTGLKDDEPPLIESR